MRKYTVLIALVICGIAFAHNQTYQGKSYTFHREGHVIDVELDHGNTLRVNMDTVEIGTRTNFCTPVN
jgi:hypothetical protein